MDEDQPPTEHVDEPQWHYDPGDAARPSKANGQKIEWTASEFIEHTKGVGWYFLLIAGGLFFAVVVYFLTRDLISAVIIIFAVILIAIIAARQPRVLDYAISGPGLSIGNRQYDLADFKSFSVVDEGAFSSVVLMPMKRFMPPLSIYYDPKDEERIVDVLSEYLPLETHKPDLIDQLLTKIRF